MKNKLKACLQTDLFYVNTGLTDETDPKRRSEICWNARQRALGMMDMAQHFGVKYEDAEALFNQHCKELEVLEYEASY